MITFKQFLLEGANADLNILDAKTIARVIFEDCKPFLRESKFDPENTFETGLFRGIVLGKAGPEMPAMKIAATIGREPKDSDPKLQKVLDDYFKEKFGYRYRADGTFCTYNARDAASYGDVYLIFPAGEFSYCYSRTIGDAYLFFDNRLNGEEPDGLREMGKTLGRKLEDPMLYGEDEAERKKRYSEWLDVVSEYLHSASPYTDENLRSANVKPHFGTSTEIMLGCKSYYALYCPQYPTDNPAREKTDDVLVELFKLLHP